MTNSGTQDQFQSLTHLLVIHLLPTSTGHPPWKVSRSVSPEVLRLTQTTASPWLASTLLPVSGKVVAPPASTWSPPSPPGPPTPAYLGEVNHHGHQPVPGEGGELVDPALPVAVGVEVLGVLASQAVVRHLCQD